jgi:hypothetical protein
MTQFHDGELYDMQCRFYYVPGMVNHDFYVYELLKGKSGKKYKHGIWYLYMEHVPMCK